MTAQEIFKSLWDGEKKNVNCNQALKYIFKSYQGKRLVITPEAITEIDHATFREMRRNRGANTSIVVDVTDSDWLGIFAQIV